MMLVAIFRDQKTNKIKNHQKLPEHWSEKDASEHSAIYNGQANGFVSEIILVQKDSVVDYLLSKLDERVKFTRETIDEALRAISEAECAVNSLQVAEKE